MNRSSKESFHLLPSTCYLLLALLCLSPALASAQAENVPATHPVYTFLKRMAVKGVVDRYFDAVLPLSRREVAVLLDTVTARRSQLSRAESDWLDDYRSEFQYDMTGETTGFHSLIDSEEPTIGEALKASFSNREKFLYYETDSTVSLFVNGLFDADHRAIHGDDLGNASASYLQLGGRLRGSVWKKLGFEVELTNAGFRGSRDLLARDPIISQSHELSVTNTRNFDYAEGYVRYDANVVSAEVGRERIVWGTGYDQKLTASDNVGIYDVIRFDAQYKALKYTFMHAWLMGTVGNQDFHLPFDTAAVFTEPVASDKYFAAHRLELSFPRVIDVGVQEMVIYSNRAPDLAYMNPVTIFEPAQRSRGERDNMFWLFDVRTRAIKDIELQGSVLFDDINFPNLFGRNWTDRYGFQGGMFYADMFGIENTSLMVEYTRIEPYVFSHGRSRDDSYTSLGRLIGATIGPNADQWFLRADYLPERNLTFSARVHFVRQGLNVFDASGQLVRNVGGDVFAPHRDSDPETKVFLDGILQYTRQVELQATWECINQVWLEASFMFESEEIPSTGWRDENGQGVMHIKVEL